MGCASSKQAPRDRRGGSPPPYVRSQSMPTHHLAASSPRKEAGSTGGSRRHVVALTSSTLGSLKLDSSSDEAMMKCANDRDAVGKARAWSDLIDRRMPKTIANSNRTPADADAKADAAAAAEPETINAWELMEGLEDAAANAPATVASPVDSSFISNSTVAPAEPMRMQIAPGDSMVSEFDPDIISDFRGALDQPSPLRSPEPVREQCATPKSTGIVKARVAAFQEKIDAKRSRKRPPNGERKVVHYLTSLRGFRRTHEDCRAVKAILRGYGVRVDERDVLMHGGFKEELDGILGAGLGGSRLPRVFADGKYLGGADEVRQMHEDGELGKALEGCESSPSAAEKGGGGGGGGVCAACGDMRFVPCEVCSGSCKVFVEEEEDVVVSGFRRCTECNENGLVRCPLCC